MPATSYANCTVDQAIASFRDTWICGSPVDFTRQIRETKSDQQKHLSSHFNEFSKSLERFVIDNCPRQSKDEKSLNEFIEKKNQYCQNGCRDQKNIRLNECQSICNSLEKSEKDQWAGYINGVYYMRKANCSSLGGEELPAKWIK